MKSAYRFLLGGLLCVLFSLTAAGQTKWFTTYYSTWNMADLGVQDYTAPPWEIDWTGLTHVVLFDAGNVTQTAPYWAYMFGPNNPRGPRPADTESDSLQVEFNGVANPGDGRYPRYMDSLLTIAHRNGVKVVITIQAVNPTNLNFVAQDSARTQLFVNTVVAWAERKKFDGVELDWEGWAAPLPSVNVISRFMRILYRGVHAMKTPSGAPGLIVVSAGSGQEDLYDPKQDYIVDQFNLQLYDYAYAWYGAINSNASWHIAPLHKGTVPASFEGQAYDTRGPLQWVAYGHDRSRIGLGVPTYGIVLRNVDGLFQKMGGEIDYGNGGYYDIERLKNNGGIEEWDDVRKVRSIHGTALRSEGEVGYRLPGVTAGMKFYAVGETPQSLTEKVSWMNANGFGGMMTYDFASDLDATQSIASGRRNVLRRAVATAMGLAPPPVEVAPTGSITASQTTLPSGGGTVTLSWTSPNATSASIDQNIGAVALSGSIPVTVTSTKTYTLTLRNSVGTTTYSVTITVNAPVPAPTGTFTASSTTVPSGGGPVTLTWTSLNAASASIDQGVGTVTPVSGGTRSVTVTATKTFTLTLTNSAGVTKTYTVTVTVLAPVPDPTGTLTASPDLLPAGGGAVTLTWTSTNAATAVIDQGVGTVALNGSTSVQVAASKTFTLTLTNSAGVSKQYPVTIAVGAPVPLPTGTFTASATALPAGGGTVTLTWTSSNAATASIDQGVGDVSLNGSTPVLVTAAKTFTLTLTNSAGATQRYTVPITVAAPLPTGVFTASGASVPAGGGTVTLNWSSANAASASIDQGVGTVALSGTKTVSVTATTTYTLTLANADGVTKTYSVTITVEAAVPAPTGTFTGTPLALPSGGGTVTLTWTSANAIKANLDHGIGDVAVNGTMPIQVTSGITYTLTLTNSAGVETRYTVNITVTAPAPTGTFTVSPESLPAGGGPVTLTWTSANAVRASINWGIGTVTPTAGGSRSATTTVTRTYTLTLTNASGVTKQYTTIVSVGAPLPTGSITVTPSTLPVGGGTVRLAWTSSNATSIRIDSGGASPVTVAASGSQPLSVSATKTFTLILANNVGATRTYTATVTVATPPLSGEFLVTPASLPIGGGDVNLTWNSTNATSAAIEPGVGSVGLLGSKKVWIDATTQFTLTLTNSAGATKQFSSTVAVVPSAPTGTFTASAKWLPQGGDNVTLSWTSVNAGSASIDQGLGVVAINGSIMVYVATTKTYTLTLTNNAGVSQKYQLTIYVNDPSKKVTQSVNLQSGWNMVSTYVRPDTTLLSSICREILSSNVVVKNGTGSVYWPDFSIHAITVWNPLNGYQIYTSTDKVLSFTGCVIDPALNPIPLTRGMNLVPYLRTTPLDPERAFASITDPQLIAVDGAGRIYRPSKGIRTLTALVPGAGYTLYVSGPAQLIYPANTVPDESRVPPAVQ